MIALGWLLTGIATVLIVVLTKLHVAGAPGGDRGVGWAWSLMIGHAALVGVLVMLSLALAAAGRIPTRTGAGGAPVMLAVLLIAASASISALWALMTPTGPVDRFSLAALVRFAPLLGPALLVTCAAMLLHGPASGPWLHRGLALVAVHALCGLLLLVAPSAQRAIEILHLRATRDPSALDGFQQQILDQIVASQPETDWPRLLEQTRAGNHARLRAAALVRLNELPDWEAKALAALDGQHSRAVFNWLEAETPSDPAAFAARLPAGIRREAEQVRQRIRDASHPSHLYEGLLGFEVGRVIEAATKLQGQGVEFAPSMRALRDAFGEPSEFPHPRYRAVDAIDRWLRSHG